jgi:hypothetical protein
MRQRLTHHDTSSKSTLKKPLRIVRRGTVAYPYGRQRPTDQVRAHSHHHNPSRRCPHQHSRNASLAAMSWTHPPLAVLRLPPPIVAALSPPNASTPAHRDAEADPHGTGGAVSDRRSHAGALMPSPPEPKRAMATQPTHNNHVATIGRTHYPLAVLPLPPPTVAALRPGIHARTHAQTHRDAEVATTRRRSTVCQRTDTVRCRRRIRTEAASHRSTKRRRRTHSMASRADARPGNKTSTQETFRRDARDSLCARQVQSATADCRGTKPVNAGTRT